MQTPAQFITLSAICGVTALERRAAGNQTFHDPVHEHPGLLVADEPVMSAGLRTK